MLELKHGDWLLLKAASHFADVREADFSSAASREDLEDVQSTLIERHSRAESAWRFWLVLLLGGLGAAWWFIAAPQRRAARLARA